MRNISITILTTFVFILVNGYAASAQVVLKPTGQNGVPLRARSLDAQVSVTQTRFATTDLDLVFANDLSSRVEADFLYTVPEGAVVTGFAYFYGSERVPARIAEKARAAAIYKHITTQQRDPALVEMVGKNTFRARIFPVEPNADLRVQIRYVQVLPVNAHGAATFALPLQTPKTMAWDRVAVAVRVRGNTSAVQNNFGIAAIPEPSGTVLSFSGTNYRTGKDMRVSLSAPNGGATPCIAAPSSAGGDGFFAATLTAPTGARLDPASLQSSGVPVYAVTAKRLSSRDVLITGRYKKSGTARFFARNAATGKRVASSALVFTATPQTNSSATKFWAAAQIERLARRDTPAHRVAGIVLSKRFTLPSRWTSWIAIPVEERKRYEREKAEADLSVVAHELSRLIRQGRGAGSVARAYRARFFALCKIAGYNNPGETLASALRNVATDAERRAEQARYERREATAKPIVDELYRLARAGQKNNPRAAQLRKRFDRLFVGIGYSDTRRGDELRQRLRDRASSELQTAAQAATNIIVAHGRDSDAAQKALATLATHCDEVDADPKETLRYTAQNEIYGRREAVIKSIARGMAQTPKGRETRRQYDRLCGEGGTDPDTSLTQSLQNRVQQTAWDWARKSHGEEIYWDWYNPDAPHRNRVAVAPGEVIRLREQTTRLAIAAGLDPRTVLAEAETPWYRDALRQKRNDLVAALKTVPQDPSETAKQSEAFLAEARSERQAVVARLTGKAFYTANTPDGREAFAKDRLARLAARIEAGKAEADLKTPLAPAEAESLKARVAALRETESHLRARMGDPLLFADAPRNAQSVVATLPNGEVVPLQWDAAAARWQCRFDIPTYATEGEYVVSVAITLADGASTVLEFRYTVDITAPKGIVTATRTGSTVRVEVVSDADTVRVVVVAASGTVPLVAAPARPGHFFGLVANPSATVTVVLTDRAHNRATVTIPVM